MNNERIMGTMMVELRPLRLVAIMQIEYCVSDENKKNKISEKEGNILDIIILAILGIFIFIFLFIPTKCLLMYVRFLSFLSSF